MIENPVVVSFANWKSPHMIFPLALLIIVGGFLLFSGLYAHNEVVTYVGGTLLFLSLGIWYFLVSIKIRIDSRGLEYSSLFKTAFIDWKDVRTIGGYIATRYSNLETDLKDLDKVSVWGQKFLFVSTEVNAHVNWGQKISSRLIYFHFRPALRDVILNQVEHRTQI